MKPTQNTLTIGALANATEVNVETIRFYQRKALMREPPRTPGSIRRYGNEDMARVRFIKSAQRLGFSLSEVTELLMLDDGTQCAVARQMGECKLHDVRERLAALRRIETTLEQLLDRCKTTRGAINCPLITSLQLA